MKDETKCYAVERGHGDKPVFLRLGDVEERPLHFAVRCCPHCMRQNIGKEMRSAEVTNGGRYPGIYRVTVRYDCLDCGVTWNEAMAINRQSVENARLPSASEPRATAPGATDSKSKSRSKR